MDRRSNLLFLFLITLFLHAQTLNNTPNGQINPFPLIRQLQNCEPGCLTCSSAEICIDCDNTRVLIDGKCRCKSPRVLRSSNCECPWFMVENPTTKECKYIDLIDVYYQSTVSPLFPAVIQVQMNQWLKWAIPPTFTWTVNCNYGSDDTKSKFLTYLLTQKNDVLLVPSEFLEFGLECNGKVSYNNQNPLEISKTFSFKTLTMIQPQIKITGGGPFQIYTHTDLNLIVAEVQSSSGSPISASSLEITWSQTSGEDMLDMSRLYSSSNPLRLTIQKCTLLPGKLYTFKLSVKLRNNGQTASQKITIGVLSPKISLQALQTDNYHIYNQALKLTASSLSVDDQCNQGILPKDFLDLSTLQYTWECVVVDLYYDDSRRLLTDEPSGIMEDPNTRIHPDPQHLFYSSITSKTLTLPSSYFTRYQNYQFIFYLTASVQSKSPTASLKDFNLFQPALSTSQTKSYIQILASMPFTSVKLSCSSNNNCQTLKRDPTQLVGLDFNPKYTYTWILKTFSAYFSSLIIDKNRITLYGFNQLPSQNLIPQIILQVSDGTNVASSFFTIQDYTLIQQGSLYFYPSEGGKSYETNFFVSTYLNKDADLPITFQFYTTCNTINLNYMFPKYEPFDFTPVLLPPGSGSTCAIGLLMTTSLASTLRMERRISVTGGETSLSDVIKKGVQALDSSKSSTDIFQRFRLVSVIMENLNVWEKGGDDKVSYNTSAQFKYSAISEMKDLFKILSPRDGLREIMLNNIKYASNQLFNQDRNWQLYMSILDTYFQANRDNSILSPEEFELFASILDDLIYYMKKPGNEIEDPDDIVFTYLNTIIRSTFSDVITTNTQGFNYDGTFLSLYTYRTTYCKVLQEVIRVPFFYGMRANFTLNPGQTIPPEKCDNEVDFIWAAFRPNYTVPGARNTEYRTLIYLDLRDSITGKSLLDIFAYLLLSNVEFCPDGEIVCGSNGDGGTTIYGVFDLKDQIWKIFGKSKIKQIINISALKDFKFWQSVAFWTVVGFTVWFVVSFYWLYLKHPTYCLLLTNKTISKKRFYIKTNFLFWLVHPLIGIYLYNDPQTPKATRLALYYKRVAVVMLFSTIFSSISKGEGAIFRTYIIIFNACTVIPINLVLSRTFGWAFKIKTSKRNLISFLKRTLILTIYLLFLIVCFIAIFIIQAQQDKSENGTWGVNFTISLLQDLTLAPLISITIKILLIKFSQHRRTTKLRRIRKFINFIIPNFKSIFNSIFTKNPAPIETQAPTPTEIASPLSTSRKLLKIPELETDSPALPSSPKKRVFRTRMVSESQMGNVNEAAVETLITERVQTLFSEGKTLRVKENSPVKENYSRMQSANISFASPGRFINRTSTVLSPSEISPELAIESGPGDGIFSFGGTTTSIQKLFKEGRVLGSSIFSPQTQERISERRFFGSALFSTQEKLKHERIFGSSLFPTLEKMESEKDNKSGGISTQENIKRPPPFV